MAKFSQNYTHSNVTVYFTWKFLKYPTIFVIVFLWRGGKLHHIGSGLVLNIYIPGIQGNESICTHLPNLHNYWPNFDASKQILLRFCPFMELNLYSTVLDTVGQYSISLLASSTRERCCLT